MPRESKAILAALPSKGFTLEEGKRDHHVLRLFYHGRKTSIFTSVSRGTGYKDYNDRLLAKMSRQLRITRAQLDDLIDCDMDGASYVGILLAKGEIE